MNTALDCIPCLLRQTLEAARIVSNDPAVHEQMVRDVLRWTSEMDLSLSPPAVAQRIQRRLRQITGVEDPYRTAKARQNRMALELLPALRAEIQASTAPIETAARIAIAGNMIDMGAHASLNEADVHRSLLQATSAPFYGQMDLFLQAVGEARSILYLADNAGEIAFDRLLIEQLTPKRITLAVRGAPVINDATLADAHAVGVDEVVEVIDNGSDAPGTILDDCSPDFRRRFADADVIIAKGQGNFESLNRQPDNIFFLFKVKCPMVASHIMQPTGTQVLVCTNPEALATAY